MHSGDWPRHLAFMPVMNAGEDIVSNFDFECGASLRVGRPSEVWSALPEWGHPMDVTASERSHFEIARAWLWATSIEIPEEIDGRRNVFAICNELQWQVWHLGWCIDLVGAGENSHWRGGNNLHNAGVYAHSSSMACIPTLRLGHTFSPPRPEHQSVAWSTTLLARANSLERAWFTNREQIPARVWLANDLRASMVRYDALRHRHRLLLCISALETLLVAPSGRGYLWDSHIKDRLRQIVADPVPLTDTFFEQIKERRNDAAHRGGLSSAGTVAKFYRAEFEIEVCLRDALCWAVLNAPHIAAAFAGSQWPSHVGGLSWPTG